MNLTDYHAKYFAHELTKRNSSDSAERLAGVLVDAQIEPLPHQVDAALFAFGNPLSKGALLADEVGLGKTIEAGLVISQRWAEQKRHILVITPANLRKQWYQELQEKFFLPSIILESKSYNEQWRKGKANPFDNRTAILLCSYQFARSKKEQVRSIPWDLVVMDEAHRLRNVYKPGNVIANDLKVALQDAPKILLTATPLQNSLMELYGLVSIIDDRVFGDAKVFKERYGTQNGTSAANTATFEELKKRLKPITYRTLRHQVQAYVSYTKRHSLTQDFTPEESENRLYHLVSAYLQRPDLKALPSGQRTLITLVLRKLLASSSFAIAGALSSMIARLEGLMKKQPSSTLEEDLDGDYEALDETAEEWTEEASETEPLSDSDRKLIEEEIRELKSFRELASSITQNAKGRALLASLEKAFAEAERLGAARKAIVFTESRRTQEYLLRVLMDSPYAGGIVLFNGTNNDAESKKIYAEWLERHKGTDQVTGSKSADMRSALVDRFREKGTILIATEAGAEGINLQFCSLVVNYDLPWNPQRIEQRIGRCHRYGQKHDVVVVNFLNRKNAADLRVFQLLDQKFRLFEGVFGASDEILGAIESGVDFEKRIADIYQQCRNPEEIKASFDRLQEELGAEIDEAMQRTRQNLLENFDEEVHEKLRVQKDKSISVLNRYERWLMELTRHELCEVATFEGESAFRLKVNPFPEVKEEIPLGLYELPRRNGDHYYRLGHPLAQAVLNRAKSRALEPAVVVFNHSGHMPPVGALDPFAGQEGVLLLSHLEVASPVQTEDYLLWAAFADDGRDVEPDIAKRLFSLPAVSVIASAGEPDALLADLTENRKNALQRELSIRNARLFDEEAEKLDQWAEDLKLGLEREIKDLDRQIREAKREAKAVTTTLEDKLAGQKKVKSLEGMRNLRRRSVFEAQDEIEARRDRLIGDIEGKLEQKLTLSKVFSLRWKLV